MPALGNAPVVTDETGQPLAAVPVFQVGPAGMSVNVVTDSDGNTLDLSKCSISKAYTYPDANATRIVTTATMMAGGGVWKMTKDIVAPGGVLSSSTETQWVKQP